MTRQKQGLFFIIFLLDILWVLLKSPVPFYLGMLRKMEIDKADDLKNLSEVATQMFSDVTN